MKPIFAHELSNRALKNYKIIHKEEKLKNENAYATTELVCTMLFSVISLQSDIVQKITDKGFPEKLRKLKWPNEVKKYIENDSLFISFITSLRNSVSHNDFKFIVDVKKRVLGVSFHMKFKNSKLELDFLEEDLEIFLINLTKLYESYKIEAKFKVYV